MGRKEPNKLHKTTSGSDDLKKNKRISARQRARERERERTHVSISVEQATEATCFQPMRRQRETSACKRVLT